MGYLIILLVITALLCWKFWPRQGKPPAQADTKPETQEQPFVIDPPIDDPVLVEHVPPSQPLQPEVAEVDPVPVAIQEPVSEPAVVQDDPVQGSSDVEADPAAELVDEPVAAESTELTAPVEPVEPVEPQPEHSVEAAVSIDVQKDSPVVREPVADEAPEEMLTSEEPVAPASTDPVEDPLAEQPVEIQEPDPQPGPEYVAPPVEPVAEEPKPFEPPLLFLIDDSLVVRTKLTRNVAAAGYRTLGAGDGVQGLKLFETDTPALIITDIEMPEMDGFQLIDRLNQDEATRHIPVIAISGHEGIKAQLTHFPNVVDAFKKPWDAQALLARLEELVGPGKAPEA